MGIIDKIKNVMSGAQVTTAVNKGKQYTGTYPTLTIKKTNAEVIKDTITWVKWIAGDNDFHYGAGQAAHRNGCYFCGTQPKAKKNAGIKKWEHTYCCNPFVGAAYAHGGGQRCTNYLTLSPGTYIFSIKLPVCSQNTLAFCVFSMDLPVGGWFGNGQVVQTYIWTLTETTTCYVGTSMSAETNYTYIDRGYLKAVRIA